MPNDTARARMYAARYVYDPRPRLRVRVAPITHPPEADMSILDGIPFLPSPNHATGRQGAKITDIVLHWMVTNLAGCDATFAGTARQVSAHYGIENGTIHQYVALADTAWHAGDHAENIRSIGIEHSAQPATKTTPARDASPATIATSVALIVALCRKYGIDPSHIYPHKKFYATACPGTLPIADIIARVRAQLTTPTTEVDMPLTQAEIEHIAAEVWRYDQAGAKPQAWGFLQKAATLPAPIDFNALAAAIVKAGGANITAAAIAKAVNDDAAKRLLS